MFAALTIGHHFSMAALAGRAHQRLIVTAVQNPNCVTLSFPD
jgi:hypothetical protein